MPEARVGKLQSVRDAAILVIDMLNPYEHDDADVLAEHAAATIGPISDLVGAAEALGASLVYVNDNYGDFAATSKDLFERALQGRFPELIRPLAPPPGCPFLQKVRHSAFYGTSLDHLLRQIECRRLILTGQVTEQCILYTALDAHLRHYDITVVHDAVAPIHPELGEAALRMIELNMGGEIVGSQELLGVPTGRRSA